MKTIHCQHIRGHYDIHIDAGTLQSGVVAAYCLSLGDRFVIITDDHVDALYAQPLCAQLLDGKAEVMVIALPSGEASKTRAMKQEVEDRMLGHGCGRDTVVIAVGGGVVTDLAGFVAATFCRGVRCVYVATSLLAMVDATIGGKTAVNVAQGKNLIGVFAQPVQVFCDVLVLVTLPLAELANGLAEMVKHALIADAGLLSQTVALAELLVSGVSPEVALWVDLIAANCRIKNGVVGQDEFEQTGLRSVLNFGHTLAHALERFYNYRMAHGHAVWVGLWVDSYVSLLMGYLSADDFDVIKMALAALPFSADIELTEEDISELWNYMAMDKKAVRREPCFVLLDAIGQPLCEGGSYTMVVERGVMERAVMDWLEAMRCRI